MTVTESYLLELQAQARGGTTSRDAVTDMTDASSQDIELGFTGTDNWVLGSSGQYRMFCRVASTWNIWSKADIVARLYG